MIAVQIDPKQLMIAATKVASSLKQHTAGRDDNTPTQTTVGTLKAIMELIENLRSSAMVRDAVLHRIANLEVRSAPELIEANRWKELTAELQSLAESAVDAGRKRPSWRTTV